MAKRTHATLGSRNVPLGNVGAPDITSCAAGFTSLDDVDVCVTVRVVVVRKVVLVVLLAVVVVMLVSVDVDEVTVDVGGPMVIVVTVDVDDVRVVVAEVAVVVTVVPVSEKESAKPGCEMSTSREGTNPGKTTNLQSGSPSSIPFDCPSPSESFLHNASVHEPIS